LAKDRTILHQMRSVGAATAGFDYLRIGLALSVLAWHSIILSTGSTALDADGNALINRYAVTYSPSSAGTG